MHTFITIPREDITSICCAFCCPRSSLVLCFVICPFGNCQFCMYLPFNDVLIWVLPNTTCAYLAVCPQLLKFLFYFVYVVFLLIEKFGNKCWIEIESSLHECYIILYCFKLFVKWTYLSWRCLLIYSWWLRACKLQSITAYLILRQNPG